jgi:hypothetical protein
MLLHNDQKKSGTKDVLVMRIVDCVMFGLLPKCPSCHGGRLDVRYNVQEGHGGQGSFFCKVRAHALCFGTLYLFR